MPLWKRLALLASLLAVVGTGLYWFVFRDLYYTPIELQRSGVVHDWLANGFQVALVWPQHADPSLVEGVTLALEEVNAGGGPLAGKIRLLRFNETGADGSIARQVVRNHDVVAVIGHELADGSVPASITYEKNGVLFLAPKSTDTRLTNHDFSYVFRLTPDDKVLTRGLAEFAAARKWTRVGVLHERTDEGESAADYFTTVADRNGIAVPIVQSFFHDPAWQYQDFRPMLASVRGEKLDAIMLVDELPWAGRLLSDMSKMGITEPILATDKLDSPAVWQIAGQAANNLYVASAVDPSSTDPAYVGFRERFRRRFNAEPSYDASQGYETFMLFVKACLQSRSADPVVVATTLRTNKWTGLFGEVAFDSEGNILGRDVSIKRMQNGVFQTVAVEAEAADAPPEQVQEPQLPPQTQQPEQTQQQVHQ